MEEYFDDAHKYATTEEKLNHIQPYFNHNFPLPTIKSGVMDMYHNDTDIYIDDP